MDGLVEYDVQSDHYIPMEELRAANDERWHAMVEGRWELFGGEDPEVFRARVEATTATIVAGNPGKRVAAICHGGVINVALGAVLGVDAAAVVRPDVHVDLAHVRRSHRRAVGRLAQRTRPSACPKGARMTPPTPTPAPTVRVEHDDRVTIMTIDRPEARNAVDGPTAALLADAFRAFDADEQRDVAVLTGAGGTFCAGADLKAIAAGRGNRVAATGDGPMGPTRMQLTKPVIAAVEGHAVAGGLELAIWCDLRVVARDAVFGVFCRRFGVPLVDGGTVRLPRLIGHSHALDMILTGRAVGADEALRMGLANRVVDPGAALTAAIALARELAALPQHCLRADRAAAHEQWGLTTAEALHVEYVHGAEVLAVGDAAEGAARFAAAPAGTAHPPDDRRPIGILAVTRHLSLPADTGLQPAGERVDCHSGERRPAVSRDLAGREDGMASREAGRPRRRSARVHSAVAIALLCGSVAVAHAAWAAFTGTATVTHADSSGTVNLSIPGAGSTNRLNVNIGPPTGLYPGSLLVPQVSTHQQRVLDAQDGHRDGFDRSTVGHQREPEVEDRTLHYRRHPDGLDRERDDAELHVHVYQQTRTPSAHSKTWGRIKSSPRVAPLAPAAVNYYLLTITLASTAASNTMSASAGITFTFDATQRDAASK